MQVAQWQAVSLSPICGEWRTRSALSPQHRGVRRFCCAGWFPEAQSDKSHLTATSAFPWTILVLVASSSRNRSEIPRIEARQAPRNFKIRSLSFGSEVASALGTPEPALGSHQRSVPYPLFGPQVPSQFPLRQLGRFGFPVRTAAGGVVSARNDTPTLTCQNIGPLWLGTGKSSLALRMVLTKLPR